MHLHGRIFFATANSFYSVRYSWVLNFIHQWAGPESAIGGLLASMGLNISASPASAYIVGIVMLIVGVLVLGFIVESTWRSLLARVFDGIIRPIPLVSCIHDLAKRFVSMVEPGGNDDMTHMNPVGVFLVVKAEPACWR